MSASARVSRESAASACSATATTAAVLTLVESVLRRQPVPDGRKRRARLETVHEHPVEHDRALVHQARHGVHHLRCGRDEARQPHQPGEASLHVAEIGLPHFPLATRQRSGPAVSCGARGRGTQRIAACARAPSGCSSIRQNNPRPGSGAHAPACPATRDLKSSEVRRGERIPHTSSTTHSPIALRGHAWGSVARLSRRGARDRARCWQRARRHGARRVKAPKPKRQGRWTAAASVAPRRRMLRASDRGPYRHLTSARARRTPRTRDAKHGRAPCQLIRALARAAHGTHCHV